MHLIVTKQCIQWMEMYSPKFGGQIIFSYFSHPWGILDSRKRFSLAEIFLHIEKGPLLLRSGAPADPQFWSVLHILSSWIPPVWHSFSPRFLQSSTVFISSPSLSVGKGSFSPRVSPPFRLDPPWCAWLTSSPGLGWVWRAGLWDPHGRRPPWATAYLSRVPTTSGWGNIHLGMGQYL